MIQIADGFSLLSTVPIDNRIKYSTVADMVAMAESSLYEGCLAYVTATKKYYTYDSNNTIDATLGKWREFNPGEDLEEITALEVDTLWANN